MQPPHTRPPPDLNLLRVFAALMEERSVTRAGERLALSQSAVSHALGRLRDALGDALFVREGGRMRPTPRAQEIAPGVAEALGRLEETLAARAFEPGAATGRFRVAASAYAGRILLPAVAARFRAEAPGATLVVRPGPLGPAEALDAGRADLVIGGFTHVPDRFVAEPLFEEAMVWAICAHHPLVRGGRTPDPADVAALPRLVIAAEDPDETRGGRVFEHGLERRVVWDDPSALGGGSLGAAARRGDGAGPVRVVAPDGMGALALLPGTDLAGLAPKRLARAAAGEGRLVLVQPDPAPPPAEIVALWRRERSADPALQWLRGLISEAAAALEPL